MAPVPPPRVGFIYFRLTNGRSFQWVVNIVLFCFSLYFVKFVFIFQGLFLFFVCHCAVLYTVGLLVRVQLCTRVYSVVPRRCRTPPAVWARVTTSTTESSTADRATCRRAGASTSGVPPSTPLPTSRRLRTSTAQVRTHTPETPENPQTRKPH